MDNMTIIAVASIVIAGITTSFGKASPTLSRQRQIPRRSCVAHLICLRSNAQRYKMRSTKLSRLKSTPVRPRRA